MDARAAPAWLWLYPATYIAHIAEERWAGGGFAAWASRISSMHPTDAQILAWNIVGLCFMTLGIALARRSLKWRWVITAIAAIVVVNAVLHASASVDTHTYSPGLISGAALWIPLGAFTLWREWRNAKRSTFVKGLIGAVVFHIVVVLGIIVMR